MGILSNGSSCMSISRVVSFFPSDIDNWPARVSFGILFSTVMVVGLAGNIGVIYSVFFTTKVRFNLRTVFVTSLSVADILIDLLALPTTSIRLFIKIWPFGRFLCRAVPFLQAVAVFCSSFTFMAIAVDRYFAIVRPSREFCSPQTVTWSVILVWISAAVMASPLALVTGPAKLLCLPYCTETGWPENGVYQTVYNTAAFVLQFVLPILLTSYCYICIIRLLNKQVRLRRAHEVLQEATEMRLKKRRKKTVFMSIAMVASFAICWLPLNLFNFIKDAMQITEPSTALFATCYLFGMCSTITNPLVYSWFNADFRRLITKPCGYDKNSRDSQSQAEKEPLNKEHAVIENITSM